MTVERWHPPSVDLRHAEQHLAERAAIEGQRQAESFDAAWHDWRGVIGFVMAGLLIGEMFGIGLFGFAVVIGCAMAWMPRST